MLLYKMQLTAVFVIYLLAGADTKKQLKIYKKGITL